jgi:signal transduction histidine kinase
MCAVCAVLIAFALLIDFLTGGDIPLPPHERLDPGLTVLTGVLSLAYPMVGALIASRLPSNPIGWIFCSVGLLYAAQRFSLAYADYAVVENLTLPASEYAAWFSNLVDFTGLVLAGVLVMLLFPGGRLLSRRWRIVAWTAVCGAVLLALYVAFDPSSVSSYTYVENPFGFQGFYILGFTTFEFLWTSSLVGEILLFTTFLAALFSLVLRLHRARGEERSQLKWFLYAAVPAALVQSAFLAEVIISNRSKNSVFEMMGSFDMFQWDDVFSLYSLSGAEIFNGTSYVPAFVLLLLAVFACIAILRHKLYDIDRLINRTLVYGALSACVVGTYVLAVVALGAIFQARGNIAVSLLATALVAILFQPLRSRVQRVINRMMYGDRDDPSAVTSRLGQRIEETLAPEAVLPAVVETIAQALKLPYVAILLKEGEGYRTGAAYGSPPEEPEALPLVYQREEIGRLVIAPRAPGERLSEADRRLLEDLARQTEVAVHAVRLTTDLQRSRERLVAAREEERRRLRRDLHDGLGPTLASFALKLDAARKLVRNKPGDTEVLLSRLKDQTQETVSDVRRLVYGLRPPALDDLGLVGAIRQQAESHGFVARERFSGETRGEDEPVFFTMEAPEGSPSLPAAVEVAAYRIVQEALTNVARHAHATSCRVRISVDQARSVLKLEVTDDGVGMPEGRRAGVGLSSMRERAEELGGTCDVDPNPHGGTRVLARLPLPISDVHPERARSSWKAPSASS